MIKKQFFRDISIVLSGSIIAQGINLISTPILTRIYSPESFGVLATFIAFSTFLGTISTGRYELAIILPKNSSVAIITLFVPLIFSLFTGIFLLFLILFFKQIQISDDWMLNNWINNNYIILTPFFIIAFGVYSSVTSWMNRNRRFNALSGAKIFLSSLTVFISIILGNLLFNSLGLVLGALGGYFLVALVLLIGLLKKESNRIFRVTKKKFFYVLKKFKNFPKYSIFADSLNLLSSLIVIVILTNIYDTRTVGLFTFAIKVLGAPINMFASSTLEVFKQRASFEFAHSGSCKKIYLKTLKFLILLSLPIFLIIFSLSPNIFLFVFGKDWLVSGEYAQILCIFFIMRFIASPLGYVFYIVNKQKTDLIWQLILFLVTIITVYLGKIIGGEPKYSILFYSSGYAIMYFIYIWLSYNASLGKNVKIV